MFESMKAGLKKPSMQDDVSMAYYSAPIWCVDSVIAGKNRFGRRAAEKKGLRAAAWYRRGAFHVHGDVLGAFQGLAFIIPDFGPDRMLSPVYAGERMDQHQAFLTTALPST